jgi:AraC-like DNA-binding protein
VERWLAEGLLNERVFKPSAECFEQMDRLHETSGGHQDPGESAGLAMALLAKVLSSTTQGKGRERKTRRHDLVARARGLLGEGWPVAAVAQEVGVSYPTLNRIFKKLAGISPKTYARQIRLARAEAYLAGEGLTIKEIAAELGFHSPGHFSAEFKRAYGYAPLHWRERLRRGEAAV